MEDPFMMLAHFKSSDCMLFSLFSDPPLVWIQTPIEATPHCLPESSIPYEQCSSIYDRSYTTKYSTTSSTPTITITFTRESY